MAKISISYEGNLRTRSTPASGAILETEAPKDNLIRGEHFSPTDLLAVSLGSCVLTLMGVMASRLGVDLQGAFAEVDKEMSIAPPRRISKLVVSVHVPAIFTAEQQTKLEQAGVNCPLKQSLHPDIQLVIDFHWGPFALQQ